MIGNYGVDDNDVRYRDIAEYASMVMLWETATDLKNQGKKVTSRTMREYRDAWTRDGENMDFTNMKARITDFENLIRSTGATSFGAMDNYPTLREGVLATWENTVKEYDDRARRGEFLHAVTDPDIRKYILDNGSQPMAKAFFVHNGKSVRELNSGDSVAFNDRNGAPIDFTGVVSPQEVESVLEDEFGPDVEQFLGWNGGILDDIEYRGLSHIMEAYLTKADAKIVANNFDSNVMFDGELAYNSVELLKHMRSNGYDFNVRDNNKRNQLEVRINSGETTILRVFDADANGAYMGRVYDTYNSYYYNVKGPQRTKDNTTFSADDSIAVLDYVTGNKSGKVRKAVSADSSEVRLDGADNQKVLYIKPIEGRYRSLIFADDDEALEYVQTAIDESTEYVEREFKLEEIQTLIDAGLDGNLDKIHDLEAQFESSDFADMVDGSDILVSSIEFQALFEHYYSTDEAVRRVQEEVVKNMFHSQDNGVEKLTKARTSIVGTFEDGFNPAFAVDHMNQTERGNERDAMMSALKVINYDLDKIQGNDFAVNAMKEKRIKFDPETAKGLDDITNPMLRASLLTVQNTLKNGGFRNADSQEYNSDPDVVVDDNGIIQWSAVRETGSRARDKKWQAISGEIGQVMVPDENGIINTKFQGDNNYGLVPGYTGYFSFDGDYDDRMERFRAKGFDQHLESKLISNVQHQMTRPLIDVLNDIPTTLDSSGLNSLYHGDVYGQRIETDFMDTNQMNTETKEAVLTTLSNRVRFDNQFSDYATTSAETQANRDYQNNEDSSAFSYWKVAGETNMRVLSKDIENYADTTFTGTGKTQGLVWYLADGASVNADGSVTPSKGLVNKDGETIPDKTAVMKLDYFKNMDNNAWDRSQMSAGQLVTALRVDEKVNTTLMSFGGWTFDDSYAVSKEFAERNQVYGKDPNDKSIEVLDKMMKGLHEGLTQDELLEGSNMIWPQSVVEDGIDKFNNVLDSPARSKENKKALEEYEDFLLDNGKFRPLQRGDKLSDFGGNKGTIGIVIDRDMPEDEAKKLKLDREVRFMKANPTLDAISAPYSMMSRHNAGVVHELMEGEVQDLVDPDTGEVYKSAMGQLNLIVTDMIVDNKTHAYSEDDILDGKGRKASGQVAWALQSKGCPNIMNEIYGYNDNAWSTYREYLIATGMDLMPNGKVVNGYTPHFNENRKHFEFDPELRGEEFLNEIQDSGGFLDLPFDLEFRNGQTSSELPVLSSSLRRNVELVDGTMHRSDFNNYYKNIYDMVGEYELEDDSDKQSLIKGKVQNGYDKIQDTIIDRQFDGGHNGKHSYLRDKIMGRKMPNSATGVAIGDPRREIGEAGMNAEMMEALGAKEGDTVMMFRDPVWRDGAIRAMTVCFDETAHGVAFNPVTDKSHDGDFDGDTYGVIKFDSKEANDELRAKFSHSANMIDKGNGKDELYFQSGMDLASAKSKAEASGDMRATELHEKAERNAKSTNPNIQKQAVRDFGKSTELLFREHSFGSAYVNLENDKTVEESFTKIVDDRAKGSPAKLKDYMEYHNGEKTDSDARDIQYATGVKSDDTGLAGAFSQKLVAIMRNDNMTSALEAMYPLTQGTLQIKHDAKEAVKVNKILTDDLNKLFNGKDINNPKRKSTPNMFKTQLTEIMQDRMGVDVAEEHIQAVTDVLTHNGQILSLDEAFALKGSPMDRVAYGGGFAELMNLANNGESLLEGHQNELFAPFSMRNAKDDSILVKKDTQMTSAEVQKMKEAQVQKQEEEVLNVLDYSVSSDIAEKVQPKTEKEFQQISMFGPVESDDGFVL